MSSDPLQQLQRAVASAYDIERELGGGGMSRTYVAMERALARRVVIKILSPELAAGVSVERFRREILLAAKLQHPHIVPVLAAGDADGLPWFTMPYVEGESLRLRLARGPLGVGQLMGILRDVARALEFAHSHGVVHRDIKPDNVLLAGSSATVTDFGIAKAITAARADGESSTLTMAGTSIGSPAYMAPEQAAGDPNVDHRADLYAFGCMAYEMLAGRPPFVAASPSKLLGAHLGEAPQPINEHRTDVPPALAALVMQCLAKNPADRPAEAADLVHVLDSVTSSGAARSAPAILAPQARLGRAIGLWAVATGLVLLTAWAATVVIGLPAWVLPGAVAVMLAGLPAIVVTAWVQRTAKRVYTTTPTLTPGGTPAAHSTLATLALKASPHVSWRRTWLGGATAVGGFATLVIGFMVTRALGVGPAATLMGRGEFGAAERLVVADFRAPATDATLGATVAEAIRTDLAQSATLGVMTRQAAREVLSLMQKPTGTTLEFETSREIATREGAKAVLDGSVDRLGPSYVVAARLVAALDGRELATFRVTAVSDAELIGALGGLAKQIRERIGESLKTIRDTKPLERVTTASLPALRKYVEGMHQIEALGDNDRGLALLYDAVGLDSAFAMAWRRISAAYQSSGMARSAQMAAIQRAYQFRERLSEPERLTTEAGYYTYGPAPDLDRAIAAYAQILERDSLNTPALNNTGIAYQRKGDFERAEAMLQRAVAVANPFGGAFANLAHTQGALGRPAAVESTAALFAMRLPSSSLRWYLDYLAALARHDLSAADSLARGAYTSSAMASQRFRSALSLSQLALTRGRIRDGLRLGGEAESVLIPQSASAVPALRASLDSALAIALIPGDAARARRIAHDALARIPMQSLPAPDRMWDLLIRVASASNDAELARSALRSLERDFPEMGEYRGALEHARALTAFVERRSADAIREFREAGRLHFSCPRCTMVNLALAFDQAGQRDSAITYFQQFVDTPRALLFEDRYFLAGAYARLGDLYADAGDAERAAEALERFIELWSSADPELQPAVRDARAKLDRLRAGLARRG